MACSLPISTHYNFSPMTKNKYIKKKDAHDLFWPLYIGKSVIVFEFSVSIPRERVEASKQTKSDIINN